MNNDNYWTYCKGQKKESSQKFRGIQCFTSDNGVPYLKGMSEDKSPTIRRRIPHYPWISVNCICIFLYIYSNCVFCFSIWLHVFVCCGRLYIPFSRLHWSSFSYHTPWICPLCWCYVTLPAWAGIAVAFWHFFKEK